MRVLIAGGGTGGHIYIGIAVAQEIRQREGEADFLFVGTERGLESRILPNEGYRLAFIDSAGLKGMKPMKLIRNLAVIPRSLLQSRRIVKSYDPAVVVGLGGYSSGPLVFTAWWRGKPTLIIEPNARPGLANRILARIVDTAAIAMPEAAGFFGSKALVTGIPVRKEFAAVPERPSDSDSFTLLVYGGSQGSHALNRALCSALPYLKSTARKLQIIHQTGEKELESVREAYRANSVRGEIRAYLPRIYEDYARADLILSRAGAGTLAELALAGRPVILVPFAKASDDHQTHNAKVMERAGAARVLPESELDPERLAREILDFASDPERVRQMSRAARKLAKPDAAARIAAAVLRLAAGGRPN